jgi:hypothetical protein
MAFQLGSQVNAALGRTDFTPFLQGAMQGAQAQGRAGELIGQGLAGLGQQVASGIENYYKKEDQKQIEQQGIEFIKSNVPGIDEKAARAGLKAAGGAAAFVNFMSSQRQSQEAAREKEQVDSLTEILRQGGGTSPSPISNEVARSFSPATLNSAREQYLKQSKMEAEINKLNAETGKELREKEPTPGVVMTQAQVDALPAGTDYKGTPLPDGTIFVTGVSRFAPSAQTNINMGENAYKKRAGDVLFDRDLSEYDAVSAAPDRIQKLDDVLGVIKSGDITTGFGAELFLNANRIKAKFLDDKKAGKTVQNTELLDSLLGSDVFPMISALGVGARGMDTPAEREFLRQAFTGTKEFDNKTLERLTEIRRDIELRTAKKYKDNYDKGTYKRFFEESGRQVPDFNSIPPKGVTSLQWSVMTPEQKALFQE